MAIIKKSDLVHFIGIGGCGMSAIAKIMLAKGYKISGSDIRESVNTIRLREEGATIHIGHDASNLRHINHIVVTTAIKNDNAELTSAIKQKIPIKKRAEALAWLMDEHKVRIAIGGTHGKTTTTAMAATVLSENGLQPTFTVGGDVNSFNTNAQSGNGCYFVTEADESDGSILYLSPTILLVTNIEEDHLEYLGNLEKIEQLFLQIIKKIPKNGHLIINKDSPSCQKLLEKLQKTNDINIITYGKHPSADYHISNTKLDQYKAKADVYYKNKDIGTLELNIPGIHNLENALSIIALGSIIGLSEPKVLASIKSFLGTKRRFQKIGVADGITIIDDYAHHPTEIRATLDAAKSGFNSRIVCVFQPHRYTRTMFFLKDFAKAFESADIIIITDVYSAGEHPIKGISGKSIIDEMNLSKKSNKEVLYIPKKEEISIRLLEILKKGDLLLTMGAGDINNVAKETLIRIGAQNKKED